MTSALLVDIMVKEGKSLSELVKELPVYYTTKRKMKIPVEKMGFLMTTLLDMTKDQNRITIDGIKVFRDTGWILIRPSGTEPIYRCFSEGPTQEKSDTLCDEGMSLIEKALTQS